MSKKSFEKNDPVIYENYLKEEKKGFYSHSEEVYEGHKRHHVFPEKKDGTPAKKSNEVYGEIRKRKVKK